MTITIPELTDFYSDDDRAVITRKAELAATGKRRQTDLAEVDAAIATQGDINPNPESQVQSLIDGIAVSRQQPLSAKRTEIQIALRDIEQALDYMAGKERQVNYTAGARLAKAIKSQVETAEKELAASLVIAHEKHLVCFKAKRHLINNGIGIYGLFDSNVDEVLGIPVDSGTPLADYLRDSVRKGHLKSMPASCL